MRSIHTTNQKDYKKDNNTPYRVIHQHRTKLGNPIRGIIILAISIISLPLLSAFSIYADSNVSFSVNNNDTVLELTIPESINLDLTPSSANNYISFGTVDLNILAGTNNLSGYTLTMKADSDTLARTSSITDGNGVTIAPTISPLSLVGSSVGYSLEDYRSNTYNNYTLNTWGYKKSTSTNFIPMPVTDIELASTDTPGNATSTTLNFAAKIDSSIPAGIYDTTINFVTVANAPPQPIYKHAIVFKPTSSSLNGVSNMDIYAMFSDPLPLYPSWWVLASDVLYVETNQLTWRIGFDGDTLTFRDKPHLTFDNGQVTISGIIAASTRSSIVPESEWSGRFQIGGITSDIVTLAR